MKIIIDEVVENDLKEYLLSQNGINKVDYIVKDFISEISIDFDKNITPSIVMKYIDLYLENDYPILLEFNKEIKRDFKILKYTIDDMCCEFCYKFLIEELFNNKNINSVQSNYDFYKPAFNIEFIIEYDTNYKEDELIKYLEEKNK